MPGATFYRRPRRPARQRAQQNLLKSLRLYSAPHWAATTRAGHAHSRSYWSPKVSTCAHAVFDTNVVLDLFVFQDRRVHALRTALEERRIIPSATAPMVDELRNVLTRGVGPRWPVDAERTLADWTAMLELRPPPSRSRFRCSDPDDQMFIDLAVELRPSMLLTRDRALLHQARAASHAGVRVVMPERWAPV
jgi:uncharacterized protein